MVAMMQRFLIVGLLVGAGSAPAAAADCSVEAAIYRETEQSVELRFRVVSGENTPVSNGFSVVLPDGSDEAEAHVIYDPEIERPVAMIMKDCPEGDVTGADIAACTIWRGIVFGLDRSAGSIAFLPDEGTKAPDQLILPGFGPALALSGFGKKIEGTPSDVFIYKECSSRG